MDSQDQESIEQHPSGTDPAERKLSDCDTFESNLSKLTQELDKIEIHWPGGGKVNFNDDASLKRFMENQYPKWKNRGEKTSVPCVRISQIIIPNEQLGTELQKHYKALQKGDEGESKMYRLFVTEVSTDDSGIIILPNVDGSHIFEKGGPGSVEIDMIVAHPTKGIFVFNVKNEIKVNKQKLQSDFEKHKNFVRYLLRYNTRSTESSGENDDKNDDNEVPIHNVYCSLAGKKPAYAPKKRPETQDEPNLNWYDKDGQTNQLIVFYQWHFNEFARHWKDTLQKIPEMKESDKFDFLIARLVALNSMEGDSALIHRKFVSEDIQSIKVKTEKLEPWLEKQIDEVLPQTNDNCKQKLIRASKSVYNQTKNEKTTVILWTREQLGVIGKVFKGLTDLSKDSEPLRINVRGTKGSGKTMLMIHLAKLAKSVLFETGQTESKVVIFDGSSLRAMVLFSQMKQTLNGSGIEFWTAQNVSEKLDKIGNGIIFIDEDPLTYPKMQKLFLKFDEKGVHFCIFSSEEPVFSGYGLSKIKFNDVILSHAMRSTKQLHAFSRNIVRNANTTIGFREIYGTPSHSLEGTNRPEILYVKSTNGSEMETFFEKCIQTIVRYARMSNDKSSVLVVTNFLSPKSQIAIISALKKEKIALRSFSHGILIDRNDENLPFIRLESSDRIYGSEFASVVLMLEKLTWQCSEGFRRSFRAAVTRATTNLAIVISNTTFFNSPLEEKELTDAICDL